MADDAGGLLVRSGLVSTAALDAARARVEQYGGTLGEQLVYGNAIADEALTAFYKERLLVPLVNPNTLARLSVRVVASLSQDLAIELRAIPVSFDDDNNLTIAMSDPSDSAAVDEIAFFTGSHIVRAAATQMQIAWCLAHYYGHVTPLGQRLLQGGSGAVADVSPQKPRTRGLTGKVEAARHRGIPPVTGAIMAQPARPASNSLEPDTKPNVVVATTKPAASIAAVSAEAAGLSAVVVAPEAAPQKQIPSFLAETPRMRSEPAETDGVPAKQPRARSISGEIRVPPRRAESVRPAPVAIYEDEDSSPVISVEILAEEDQTAPAMAVPKRKRKAKTDPPELAARAGEIGEKKSIDRKVDEGPGIIISDDIDEPALDARGEMEGKAHRDLGAAPSQTIQVVDDDGDAAVIHESIVQESGPVLLDRAKAPSEPPEEVVELSAKKAPRIEKKTQVGMGAVPAVTTTSTRPHRDTEASAIPEMGIDEDADTGGIPTSAIDDPTALTDTNRFGADDDDDDDEVAEPPAPAPPRAPSEPHVIDDDDDDEDDDDDGAIKRTAVMSAVELDDAIPDRQTTGTVPAHLAKMDTPGGKWVAHDELDDGWGPPGTTIPPPLLGAIPGGVEGDGVPGRIPMSDVDSAPLIVAPPSPPETSRSTPRVETASTPVRALEDATARMIELIRGLEHAQSRDEVVDIMIDHLAETHRRAGFFMIRPTQPKGATELALFAMEPPPQASMTATIRLDQPSTLADVVGTRLPYRGVMHDEPSRAFLAAILGSTPAEILLVPVAVRERTVGVLFGEHRVKHTFDDQLAIAARAAGMALERVLKAKRGS